MFSLQCIGEGSKVSSVWGLPGHVIIASFENTRLMTKDRRPVTYKQVTSTFGAVMVQTAPSKINSLLFLPNDPHKLVVVYQNSLVEFWSFSLNSYEWCCHGNMMLSENSDCHLVSALLHQRHNAIYWCEGEPEEKFSCAVYCRSLPKDFASWQKLDFGAPVGLIENCPSSSVYEAGDSLVIWPQCDWPPGVYLKWLPSTFRVQVVVNSVGVVVSEKKQARMLDFQSLVVKATTAWHQAEAITSGVVIQAPGQRNLLVLEKRGRIVSICDKPETQNVMTLSDNDLAFHEVCWCFRIYKFFVTCSKHEIRIYSYKSSELIQQIRLENEDEEIKGVWTSDTTIPLAGVYSDTHVYQLQLSEDWSNHVESPAMLLDFNRAHQGTLQALEEIHSSCFMGAGIDEYKGNPGEAIKGELFQSPAILQALLQQVCVGGKPCDPLGSLLQKAAGEASQALPTKLSQQLASLVQEYWDLDREKVVMLQGTENKKLESLSVRQELHWLLGGAYWLPLDTRFALLVTLIEKTGVEVLNVMLEDLGIKEMEGVDEEQAGKIASRLWSAILFPSAAGPTSKQEKLEGDLRFLKVLAHLCFMEEPKELKALVSCAIRVMDLKTGADNFQRNQHIICQQILDCLPSPEKSHFPKAAAIALAWLLTESSVSNCEHEALACLLDYGLWMEGIQLVRILANSDKHQQVFQLLINMAVQEKKLPEFCEDILDVAPEDMSSEDLLNHLKHLYSSQSDRTPSVFTSTSQTDIPLGALKKKLCAKQGSPVH